LNSIGRSSNAHGLAGLLGMLAFVVAGGSNLIIVSRPRRSGSDGLDWCRFCWSAGACSPSSSAVCCLRWRRRVFAARRENLALLLSDK
jgi:hypothetical protein